MAVENKWINDNKAVDKLANPAKFSGAAVLELVETFEVAAADSDGSIYKIASIGANLIPSSILVNNDAMTAATDYDLGLYDKDSVVIDKEVFAAALDMSAAAASGSEKNGLGAVDIADLTKKMYEHAGHTINTKDESYILALTANTVGTAAGTITLRARFIQG